MFEVSNDEFMTERCGLLFCMVLALNIDQFVADFSPLIASLNLLLTTLILLYNPELYKDR